jgi:hypothetical protein
VIDDRFVRGSARERNGGPWVESAADPDDPLGGAAVEYVPLADRARSWADPMESAQEAPPGGWCAP